MNAEDVTSFAQAGVVNIRTSDGSGSGWIYKVDSTGRAWILTNEHVVRGSVSVDVHLFGQQLKRTGTVIGVNDVHDLAVVSICCNRNWQALEFITDTEVNAGAEVVALGFPYREGVLTSLSVSRGIVSSFGQNPITRTWVVQTDAALNPGNSGGPLINRTGEVIGIVSFSIDEAIDGSPIQNIGFAISTRTVLDELQDLEAGRSTVTIAPTVTPVPETEYKWFSLQEGQMVFEDDGFIETFELIDDIRNFSAFVEFEVPYSSRTGTWDFGFIFRDESAGEISGVRVQANGVYRHSTVRSGEWNTIKTDSTNELRTFAGAKNTLRLHVIEDRAWFLVNDVLVTDLDLNGSRQSGRLRLATGITTGSGIPGRHINFNDVEVREILELHGSEAGELTTSEYIGRADANVDVSFGYAEATIELYANTANWSMGIGFRRQLENDDYLIFHINDHSQWSVEHATRSGDSWRELDGGRSSEIDVTSPIYGNHLEVFFAGSVAYVYVNGQSLGSVDISSVSGAGDVSAMFGIFLNDDSATARFKDFSVWGVDS